MNKFFVSGLSFLLASLMALPVAQAAETGPANTVLRVPSGGGRAKFGAVDLTQSAAVTGLLPVANGGSGGITLDQSYELRNLSLAASVAGNALTVALKGANGSDPSGTNVVKVGFRNATLATGTYAQLSVSGALSVTVSSGSTLGHTSAIAHPIYVYLLNNAGTVELAVSSTYFPDGTIRSTTAEGGAGAADGYGVIYSTTARSNVATRVIGRLTSTQATAGTYATAISEIRLVPFEDGSIKLPGVSGYKFVGAYFNSNCSTDPCPDVVPIGDGVTSINRGGTGLYTVNIRAGVFTEQPLCWCTTLGGNTTRYCSLSIIGHTTGTTVGVDTVNLSTAALSDLAFGIGCVGK